MRTIYLAVALLFVGCQESPVEAVKAAGMKTVEKPKEVDKPKELTRESAKALLEETGTYPKKIGGMFPFVGRGETAEAVIRNKNLETFVSEGYVQVTPRSADSPGGGTGIFDIRATEAGLKYWIRKDDSEVHACDQAIVEITGIRFNGTRTKAIAEISTRYTNPTPFWSYNPRCHGGDNAVTPAPVQAYFALWDDGWRVETNPGMEFVF